MQNDTDNTRKSNQVMELGDHPRWKCTKLDDVRRRLVDVIKRIEKEGPTKTNRDAVNYYRLLVYAYQTLASVVRDAQLDEMEARLSALERNGEKA